MKGKTYENACPVCANEFNGEYFEYEICPRYGWEDNPNQSVDPDLLGANGNISFRQAVENYAKTGKALID